MSSNRWLPYLRGQTLRKSESHEYWVTILGPGRQRTVSAARVEHIKGLRCEFVTADLGPCSDLVTRYMPLVIPDPPKD